MFKIVITTFHSTQLYTTPSNHFEPLNVTLFTTCVTTCITTCVTTRVTMVTTCVTMVTTLNLLVFVTTCERCCKTFSSPHGRSSAVIQLRRHVNAVHLKLRPHKCPLCEVCFALKHHVKNHLKSVHKANFWFQIMMHINTTGAFCFICTICSADFIYLIPSNTYVVKV